MEDDGLDFAIVSLRLGGIMENGCNRMAFFGILNECPESDIFINRGQGSMVFYFPRRY